jgi:ferric-dicitrate binding protein FerR (iron transport regulator)
VDAERIAAEERELRTLLRSAGQRPAVPPEELARITRPARQLWQQRYGAQPVRARRWPYAAAAAVLVGLVALGAWWTARLREQPVGPAAAAYVEEVAGNVSVSRGGRVALAAVGQKVLADSSIVVADGGRLALRLSGGESLRLNRATFARLKSAERIELQAGMLYVDSAGRSPDPITIQTATALFRPVGTQFLVSAEGGGANVRVRQGAVQIISRATSTTATAGEEVAVRTDGSMLRNAIGDGDEAWDWAVNTPSFVIEGRTLHAFLDWVAHEKGWRLRFATDAIASHSNAVVLHGSIEGLTIDQALQTVILGAGLRYRVERGVLIVE